MSDMTAGATAVAGAAAGERTAARAYLRLLAAVRAVLGDRHELPYAGPLLALPLAEADAALGAAGIAGNERDFLSLVARQAASDDPRGPAPGGATGG
ncbi:hypothetical protein [Streptomyces sp. 8L]|uniref:hypothetical protein n=1 Tax=Streptomyces sp. 8L TaxID=2877242 RepID=UPI001CD5A226|nr:hypothetical protein [Streptomyces sp. 8L]MCA1220420.1 hypothetical protein [Streptomyces sp. 8L]